MTPAYRIEINASDAAKAMMVSENDFVREMQDGRVASRFVELWAETLFGVTKHSNTNHKSSDAADTTDGGDTIEYAIRTLTKGGIKFQDSKFIGAGRSCDLSDLKNSIRRSDKWLVFDIRFFPVVTAYKLRCAILETWIDAGELKPSGLSSKKFCDLLNRDSIPMTRELEF